MEVGALLCTPRIVRCSSCPLASTCRALSSTPADSIPTSPHLAPPGKASPAAPDSAPPKTTKGSKKKPVPVRWYAVAVISCEGVKESAESSVAVLDSSGKREEGALPDGSAEALTYLIVKRPSKGLLANL
eukprot:RCo012183